MNKQEVLEKFDFYHQLSTNHQKELESSARYFSLPAGKHLYFTGDDCHFVNFFGRGDIRIYLLDKEGHEVTLFHVGPGAACVLNVSCALSQKCHPANALVENDVEGVALSRKFLRACLDRHSAVRDFVCHLLVERLSKVIALVKEVSFETIEQRLAKYLLNAFTQKRIARPHISTTHNLIAREIGTSRKDVSRVLEKLQRDGTIKLGRGRIYAVDMCKLESLLGEQPS